MGFERGGEGSAEGRLWREIARRLLSDRGPDGVREEVHLFAGEVPEEASVPIPVPEGMSVLGGMVRPGSRYGAPETEAVVDARVGAADAIEAYRALMGSGEWAAEGWAERRWPGRQERGFASVPVAESAVFCRGRRGPAIVVEADEADGGGSEVRLSLFPAGRDTPCAHEEERWGREPNSVIPLLLAPPGAREIEGGSASYGGGAESATAVLRSDLPPRDLAAHYAAQLEAGGWTRLDEGSDGPLAWSAWKVRDEEGEVWRGVFFAARFPGSGGSYELQVSARLADG